MLVLHKVWVLLDTWKLKLCCLRAVVHDCGASPWMKSDGVAKDGMYLLNESRVCTEISRNCAADGVCNVLYVDRRDDASLLTGHQDPSPNSDAARLRLDSPAFLL